MKNLVTALFLCCALALAQSHPAVAIHNAKIVTVSGSVITKGTVVVRNGLIEAVGENVAVPADAMLVEGEGLTVYPGLIDAFSTWGQPGAAPAAAATATAGRGGRGTTTATPAPTTTAATQAAAAPARGPEDRPQTTSWLKIADEISATDRRIETARAAGFTTAVTFPTRGIFAGQGAVIDLISGEKPGEMVVALPRRTVHLHHRRRPRRRHGPQLPQRAHGLHRLRPPDLPRCRPLQARQGRLRARIPSA